ncbi:MAG TPA: 23S rRNA (adenine(2503)-C(2))-methyltransferase RlmN [Gemmatimonadaceae bacterium]
MQSIHPPRATVRTGTDRKVNLKSLGESELCDFVEAIGEPRFRGRQLFSWLYGKGVSDFGEMTNLPAALRSRLPEVAEAPRIEFVREQVATDATIKALTRLPSGRHVETVLIPDFDETGAANRLTVCVSSQVGCAMGCGFCATGRMGFHQNLVAGEIYDQVWLMNELAQERFGRRVTNVVFMGMGEPLLNYDQVLRATELLMHPGALGLSPRRITVSTVGLARRIRQLADDGTRFKLAISLHAPSDEKRSSIMPVNRSESTDLTALRDAVQHYARTTGQRVTYEYCMFDGFNDSETDARRLAAVARWAPSKVNLIMYNPVPGLEFQPTPEDRLNRFIRVLVNEGVTVTVRRSRGQDIAAACGQLAGEAEGGR